MNAQNGAGRVALITGAAQGLGRAIAERLAKDGIALVIGDIDHDAAQATARDISASGVRCVAVHLDVSEEDSVKRAVAEIVRTFGGLHILVNNAGIGGVRASLEDLPLTEWESTIRINLTGTFLMCRAAIPFMKQQRWGRIVNVSSITARSRSIGGVGKGHYAASKAGQIGLSRVLAEEVGRHGITVNCIAPSRTLTPLTLANACADGNTEYFDEGIARTVLGRLAMPEDSANAIAFLCSEEADFITGTVIDVNGGAFMT